jgi:GTPase SAR1 family protein
VIERSIGLNDLAPIAVEETMFVPQNDQSDTPDPADGVVMEYPTADFTMHGQDSLSNALRSPSLSIRHSPSVMPEQASQSGRDSPRTPTRAVAQQSSSSTYVPRIAPNPFGVGELADSQPTSAQTSLQRILQDSLPERLEAAVVKGVALLSEIEEPLRVVGRDPDALKWLQQIERVRDLDKSSRAVIGVVGNTGAGKSSVINALLDEERLVPTNCMRACTAVVTEISYNNINNESARYRAEIEFVQPEDWRRELKVLFEEVFDAKGISKDAHNPDSIAGVAYAKIRAIYPKHTKDMLRNSTIDQLMSVPSVSGILGTIKCIQSRDCASFYQRLQHYVDSQQKSNVSKGAKPVREVQLWPLIQVVRIYTKANALSTGAVIVDLPGVHDSNAARAAVAESYIKECTGLWIVAPITRAVDDKAAKTLLGTTFKCQLKYDGSYGAVTFICSKTDDISTTEATDALQLGDIMATQDAERDSIDRENNTVRHEKRELQADRDTQDDLREQHDEQITYWEEVLQNIESGRPGDATVSLTKKRKRATDHESTEAFDDQSLTVQQVQSKINEHKRLKQIAREHGQKLRDDISRLQKSLNDLEKRKTQVDQATEALCIEGRNNWSRGRIREDFADGIRELDQENVAEENPDEFDPEEDFRDYDKVASSLSVFCVSSRAYQKLSGRLQKDGDINGFTTLSQTEIPQLQAHCRKLTEAGRQEGCRTFLNSLSRLLTSLSLWASDDGSSPQSSTQQRKMMQTFVTRNLQTLEQQLVEAVDRTMEDVVESLDAQLFGFLDAAAKTAAEKAVHTSNEWGAPREKGGLFWATYKATVRRYGVFHGASGNRDFNTDLTTPMVKELMNCWEKTFQRRLPEVFNSFPMVANTMIKDFHNAVEQRCVSQSLWVSRIARLSDNIVVLESAFNDLARQTISNVNEAQREINREFTPSVCTAMAPAYEQCSEENGKLTPSVRPLNRNANSTCRPWLFRPHEADHVRPRLRNTQ